MNVDDPSWPHATVADAMVRSPKVHGGATTVGQARELFGDDHVHALLVVDAGLLDAVVVRDDLPGAPATGPASVCGRLDGRVVAPEESAAAVWRRMVRDGLRRLAVVDRRGALLGLLCLKRSGRGFCSDADVAARAADRDGCAASTSSVRPGCGCTAAGAATRGG